MIVKHSSPGKIFLCGEYMAIEKGLSFLLSTNCSVQVSIEKAKRKKNIFFTSVLGKEYTFEITDKFDIKWLEKSPGKYGDFLSIATKVLKIRPIGDKISINSNLLFNKEKKIGIGSTC